MLVNVMTCSFLGFIQTLNVYFRSVTCTGKPLSGWLVWNSFLNCWKTGFWVTFLMLLVDVGVTCSHLQLQFMVCSPSQGCANISPNSTCAWRTEQRHEKYMTWMSKNWRLIVVASVLWITHWALSNFGQESSSESGHTLSRMSLR